MNCYIILVIRENYGKFLRAGRRTFFSSKFSKKYLMWGFYRRHSVMLVTRTSVMPPRMCRDVLPAFPLTKAQGRELCKG